MTKIVYDILDAAFWAALGSLITWVYIQQNYVCMQNLNHLFDWLYK